MNFKSKIFVSGICILALIWLSLNSYLNFDKYDPSIQQFLENPAKYDGKIASHKGDIVYVGEKMYLKSNGETILLNYKEKIPKAKFGYTLIKGIFRFKTETQGDYIKQEIENNTEQKSGIFIELKQENYIEQKKENYIEVYEYWNNDYNYVKYIISFFALIYVVILFFKEWKLTIKGFVAKKKRINPKQG